MIERLIQTKDLKIRYKIEQCKFGKLLVAATDRGVCYMGFTEDLQEIFGRFPDADFSDDLLDYSTEKLHLKGTDFQVSVWEELLKIPCGKTLTYKELAVRVGREKAVRAVGSAVGKNPVSPFIPCHRVVGSGGSLGGYYWGLELKKRLLEDEK